MKKQDKAEFKKGLHKISEDLASQFGQSILREAATLREENYSLKKQLELIRAKLDECIKILDAEELMSDA